MANKNALNKNSLYVESLVDFLRDTKPYHVKLTEIVEEYRFFEDVKVNIVERFTSKMKIDSTWTYNYFSSANPLYRTMPAQRLVSPSFSTETHVVGTDEVKDLALVLFVYSKKGFDGPGVHAAYLRHPTFTEPLVESVDYFQSHGSFQFQVKQTVNANGDFDPQWSMTTDDGVITLSRKNTREQALNAKNPNSSYSNIRRALDEIQAAVNSIGGHSDVQDELDILYVIMNRIRDAWVAIDEAVAGDATQAELAPLYNALYALDLPQTYEALLAWAAVPNTESLMVPLNEPKDRQYYEQLFSINSPPLFFGKFTDLGVRESGLLGYRSVTAPGLRVTNIVAKKSDTPEEWLLTPIDFENYRVSGSSSGFLGFVKAGQAFNHTRVSFSTTIGAEPLSVSEIALTPTRKIVVSQTTPLETWNIIKVNPIAHDRPQFISPRLGHLLDQAGNIGSVTILDQLLPSGDIMLTSRGTGVFDMVSMVNPQYVREVQVGVPFNDGVFAFTIVQGAQPFPEGDRFYLTIVNEPVRVENLDLGYGYDLDPYDDDQSLYDNGKLLGFYYDGRFTDYDLSQLNLAVTESAIHNRKWRARALPDYSRFIKAVQGTAGGQELRIYYADRFAIEYSDNDFKTKFQVATIPIGGSFASTQFGVSFTLPAASRPFIGVSAYAEGEARIEGGDVFSFQVINPLPRLVENPVGLTSMTTPRLVMHSDSFAKVKSATWTIEFIDSHTYKVSNTLGESVTAKIPLNSIDPLEGSSFKRMGVHFTIIPNTGLEAGDKFTFSTYANAPSYLVHGSASGWAPPATIGKYYWNGKIGFKIMAPQVQTFVDDKLVDMDLSYTVEDDAVSMFYTFTRQETGYTAVNSLTGEHLFGTFDGAVEDKFIKVNLAGITEPTFKVTVNAHDFQLWNAPDVVIVNPRNVSRRPVVGDKIVVEKTESARFGINLVPSGANISALRPITIDQRFIDLNTKGVPLVQTSPDTGLFQGWIPLTAEKWDSGSSIAEFSDPATRHVFRSATTNEVVGTLKQEDPDRANEPIQFEWAEGFFTNYLPLNAEANLVIRGTGWDDQVRARVSESIKFLLGGGALLEDWLFRDILNVKVTESNMFHVTSNYADDMSLTIEDGPFVGFMPGYDNMPFDFEDGVDGSYDMGQPPDLQALLSNSRLTELQKEDIFKQWNFYLQAPNVPSSHEQWNFLRAALAGDPNPGLISNQIGYPIIGLGIDIVDRPEGDLGAAVKEAMVVNSVDRGNLLDSNGYGVGFLDAQPEMVAIAYSGSLPPVPGEIPPGATYDSFETPLLIERPARVFEISFNAAPNILNALTPTFSIWFPGDPAPTQVAVVERLKPGLFRFSVPQPTQGKIIVG